ncbi:hypothetical protein CXZ10_05830 [Pleomorphomonas diazotrophica]|uniref:Uncharacterized protein n=1 Tax=Pleomorphomonas diazotrophica TaxID=1166257 RepID=A0A1I4Q9E2_9HYPH|nr:DUF1799 domain-containing protein [Pleomorphomonas diazotrophica]PKR90868.1 hypothetical protein CXZ10_05830 [Pleomorphomonas diazotrophica]SFM36295.1 Phage related hypothetical protein [Pleomorphomonas diazotrophica]
MEAWAAAYLDQTPRDKPATVDEDVSQQFKDMGVTITATAADEATIEIHPANEPAIAAWLECETSWRVAPTMAGLFYVGLDYVACRLVLDDLGSPPGTFADLRHMERAARPLLNKRDE